jgi:H+/Cl- antiporter ClcA
VYVFFSISISPTLTHTHTPPSSSGIPETKAFLNGIRIPNMQSLRTLAAKIFGTIFAVAAGLPLGKYGPMIHIGSIVAAFMSRGARGIRQVDELFESFRIFSTHSEKRDLVVSGGKIVCVCVCVCVIYLYVCSVK